MSYLQSCDYSEKKCVCGLLRHTACVDAVSLDPLCHLAHPSLGTTGLFQLLH